MVETISELKKICHNNKRFTDRPWWYRLSRFISIRITWLILLLRISISPNAVTVMAFIVGIGGAFLILSSDYLLVLLGFAMLFACFTIDGVDGELARYHQKFSTAGTYIDKVGHTLLDPLLYGILAYSIYRENQSLLVIILGFWSAFLINFIKTNVQLNNYIFMTEVMLSPKKLFKKIDSRFKPSLPANKQLQKLIWLVNSIKAYVPTVFYFLIAFTMDYFKNSLSFIPQLNYKLLVLLFYGSFLTVTAIGQIILNLKNLEQEIINQFQFIKNAITLAEKNEEDKNNTQEQAFNTFLNQEPPSH